MGGRRREVFHHWEGLREGGREGRMAKN